MQINNNYFNKLLQNNVKEMEKLTEQLSTGKRINKASDDTAGLQVSTRLEAQIRGTEMANRNIQDGISLLQTADGSLNEIQDMLQRVRELAIQGKNGTYTAAQKQSIENEMMQLMEGIDGIAKNSSFNGIPLLTDGKSVGLSGVPAINQRVKIDGIPVDTTPGAKTTVEFWMKWDGKTGTMPFGWQTNYDIFLYEGYIGVNSGNTQITGTPSSGLENKWAHVAVVFTNGVPDNNNVKVYIDGQEKEISNSNPSYSPISRTVSSTINIGGWGPNNGYDFGGKIDELKIWDGERTGEQIREDMHEALEGDESGLLGYWKLNDTSITDESNNGNNGVLVNGATIGEGVTEPVKIHTGYQTDNDNWVGLPSISSDMLSLSFVSLSDPNLIKKIDDAINEVSKQRGNLGAKINRFEYSIDNNIELKNNTESTKMRISDLDTASTLSNLTKEEIKMSSVQKMMTLNNSFQETKMQMLFS